MDEISPRHALITGGSSGIGRELACRLAAQGYSLTLIARREGLLKEAAADISQYFKSEKQRVFIYSADVAVADQAEAAVKSAIDELGPPDLVVTSAGVAIPGYFQELSLAAFRQSMEVNYFGSLYIVRAALPAMRGRKRGRIVFLSSGAGLMGIFGYTTYSPTKFALRGLAESLRAELKADNIGVSIVYPPDTDTPMLAEENKTKPDETKLITSVVKTWSAPAVADCILRGIQRGNFGIAPGAAIGMMNRLPGLMIPVLTWYSDKLAERVRKNRKSA